ncbi:MAG: hypothetical protein QOF08_1613 [Gaiellales bacterium]|nr:hypothetical protein [Gaiellales bacterium]
MNSKTQPAGSTGTPVLSVLMPSYNSAAFIEKSIESVLAIKGPELELIIHDACSTDGTADIVARIGDPRVHFVAEPDDGQSDALNRALAQARGEWIGWLNADDVYEPEQAARLAETFSRPLDFVYGDHAVIDAGGEELKSYGAARPLTERQLFLRGVFINCSAGFYRAEVVRRIGGWDPNLHLCMDLDLLLKLVRGRARSLYVPGSVMALRIHDAAKTQRDSWGIAKEGWGVVTRHLDGAPRGARTLALYGQLRFRTYLVTMPLWTSRAWRRVKPTKQL